MRAPTSNANIAQTTALGCSVPNVDPTLKICNGMTANEIGLLTNCPFIDFPWSVFPSSAADAMTDGDE
jgi:hypothetical protein